MKTGVVVMRCISCVLLLAHVLFASFLPRASALQASYVTVASVEPRDSFANVTGTFTVNITLADVENLYGVGITFIWNSSVLRALNIDGRLGQADGVLHNPIFVAENSLREGKYALTATSTNPAPSFNGSGTIAIVTFSVVNIGESSLDLETQLYDRPLPDMPSMPIDHTTVGGFFYGPIPEFPDFTIPIALMTLTLLAATFYRKISRRSFIHAKDPAVGHSKQDLLVNIKGTEYNG